MPTKLNPKKCQICKIKFTPRKKFYYKCYDCWTDKGVKYIKKEKYKNPFSGKCLIEGDD